MLDAFGAAAPDLLEFQGGKQAHTRSNEWALKRHSNQK